jgi:uncharacterized RDD family membrane protein YckC
VIRNTNAYEGVDAATRGMLTIDADTVVEVISEADPNYTRALYLGKEVLILREDTTPASEGQRDARLPQQKFSQQAAAAEVLPTTYCPQCASPVSPGASYCTSCGSNLMMGGIAGRDLAGFWSRFGAFIIDSILIGIVATVLALLLTGGVSTVAVNGMALIVGGAYFTIGFGMGVTLGAMVFGLRIVKKDGGEPGFGSGALRWVVSILSAIPIYLGYFWAIWDPDKQTWQDKAAGTYVVKDLAARRREIEKSMSDL